MYIYVRTVGRWGQHATHTHNTPVRPTYQRQHTVTELGLKVREHFEYRRVFVVVVVAAAAPVLSAVPGG